MPIYVCHSGAADNVALFEPGVFSLVDAAGRPWLCREAGDDDDSLQDFSGLAHELAAAHARLPRGAGSSRLHILRAGDPDQLPDRLAQSPEEIIRRGI